MTTNMKYLSHYLNDTTPAYGGAKNDLIIDKASCISHGDSCNSIKITIKNHIGTHIDLPRHFDPKGRVLGDFDANDFNFSNVQLIDLPCQPGHIISVEDLEALLKPDSDLLLIRTGFENHRNEELYWSNNPGFSPEVGTFLREKFPSIRAVAFDFISLSSYTNRELGRVAHKKFLEEDLPGNPVLIIEDVKLQHLDKAPKSVVVAPMMIEQADGIPVTILAFD